MNPEWVCQIIFKDHCKAQFKAQFKKPKLPKLHGYWSHMLSLVRERSDHSVQALGSSSIYMEDKIYGETQRTGNSQQPQLSAADGSDWTDLRRDADITQTGFEHLFSDRWDRETGFEER